MTKLIPFVLVAFIFLLPQTTEAATGGNLSGYAWSSTIGWVSMSCNNTSTCKTSSYGVQISSTGVMSGYAWSPNVGWISFNSSDLAGCPSGTCSASFNKVNGVASGWARVMSGAGSATQTGNWGGWISLSGTSPAYGVAALACEWSGNAWGGGPDANSAVVGWLNFGTSNPVRGTDPDSCRNAANLVASAVTPVTATAAVPVPLSSTISNNGVLSTVTTFTDIFQIANDVSGSGATVIGTFTNPVLAAGNSNAATLSYTFASAGVKYVRACADTNASFAGTILEYSENDNCGAWTAINVDPPEGVGPDLLAANPTPTTAAQGTSKTFSSSITNAGVATTGKTITNLFQFDNDTDHSTATAFKTGTAPILAAGASSVSTAAYTFPTSGTWYVRTCADNDQWFTSRVDEGNEGNNCSEWVPVAVSAPAGAGVTACSVTPGSIPSGASATWSATPNTLGTYTWVPSEGGAPGGTGATLVRSYSGTNATFGMTVTAGGTTVNCPNLTVGGTTFGPSDPVVTVSPPRVVPGGTTTLTINATGVDVSCVVSGPGIATRTIMGVGGRIPTTTITTAAITNQSTYTVNCDNEGDVKSIVNIIPAVQEF